MSDKPPKTAPIPSPPPVQQVVWFACRANARCQGKEAILVRKFGVPGQGCSLHYRCTTCRGAWVVNM